MKDGTGTKETPVVRNKAGICCICGIICGTHGVRCFGIVADGMRGASGIICDIYIQVVIYYY